MSGKGKTGNGVCFAVKLLRAHFLVINVLFLCSNSTIYAVLFVISAFMFGGAYSPRKSYTSAANKQRNPFCL